MTLQGGTLDKRAARSHPGSGPTAIQEVIAMKRKSSFAALVFILILGTGAAFAYAAYRVAAGVEALGVL